MGLGRLVLNLLTKSPRANGWLAALATSPYIYYKFHQYFTDNKDHSFPDFAKTGIPSIAAFLVAYLGTAVLHVYTKETDTGERTRLGDRKIVKSLEARLREQTPPTMFFAGEKQIDYSILHTLRLKYTNGKTLEQHARNEQNLALAIDAMLLYCGSERKLDDGFLLLADAFEWLYNRKPKLSRSGRIAYAYRDFMFTIARKLEPRNVSAYILAAAHNSILNPTDAWRSSMLGRMAADEFKLPQRAEMYVFHAFLATAQKRNDVEDAWKDAFTVLHEQPIWERLGETRSVVRVLKNSTFFSRALVFKERDSRAALLKEAAAGKKLASLIRDITVPQPLYITQEPHNGNYTYIMRYVEGDTLYRQLQRSDKSAMPRVISALAQIHARYPTENLNVLNIYKNLEQKLQSPDFGVPAELASRIMYHYRPVHDAIADTAVWVWNKDAHPENWIIGEKIGVLDTEGDQLIPALFDLVNLLEYGDFFTGIEKRSFITKYITDMHKEGKNVNISTSMRAYHNATIHRMIALSSAWSSPDRTRMRIYRKQALRRAVYAIDELCEEDKLYYERHRGDYTILREALNDLHKLIPS